MNAQKIVGLVAILLAIVGAFVTIPYAAAILLILGLFVGLSIIPDHHVRVMVSALVRGRRGADDHPPQHLREI